MVYVGVLQVQHLYNFEDYLDSNKSSQKEKVSLCNKYQGALRTQSLAPNFTVLPQSLYCDLLKI